MLFRFTFGSNHTGGGHYCQPIEAPTETLARIMMVAKYDKKWAFCYDEVSWPKAFNSFKSYPTPMDYETMVYDAEEIKKMVVGKPIKHVLDRYLAETEGKQNESF